MYRAPKATIDDTMKNAKMIAMIFCRFMVDCIARDFLYVMGQHSGCPDTGIDDDMVRLRGYSFHPLDRTFA